MYCNLITKYATDYNLCMPFYNSSISFFEMCTCSKYEKNILPNNLCQIFIAIVNIPVDIQFILEKLILPIHSNNINKIKNLCVNHYIVNYSLYISHNTLTSIILFISIFQTDILSNIQDSVLLFKSSSSFIKPSYVFNKHLPLDFVLLFYHT